MAELKKLVLATGNQDKVKELRNLLSGFPVQLLSIKDYPGLVMPEEDQPDFAGNAAKKAEWVSLHTGEIALADDSGLEVEALDGKPGVHSARYAGTNGDYKANNRLLLQELKGVSPGGRKARFVCVIAITVPGDKTYLVEGSCPGLIAEKEAGTNGFGYDPLFYYVPGGKTFAEMTAEEKNRISHRGRALHKTRELLVELLDLES